DPRHLASYGDVAAVAEHAPVGVIGERSRRALVPRHDHPGIQTAGQRYADWLTSFEVAGQVAREHVAQLAIVAFLVERRQFFPFTRLKVGCLLFEGAIPEHPSRAA